MNMVDERYIPLLRRKIGEGGSFVIRAREEGNGRVRFEPRLTISSANRGEIMLLRQVFGGALSNQTQVMSLSFYATTLRELIPYISDLGSAAEMVCNAAKISGDQKLTPSERKSRILEIRNTLMQMRRWNRGKIYSQRDITPSHTGGV